MKARPKPANDAEIVGVFRGQIGRAEVERAGNGAEAAEASKENGPS